jgi:hypothetical protein
MTDKTFYKQLLSLCSVLLGTGFWCRDCKAACQDLVLDQRLAFVGTINTQM